MQNTVSLLACTHQERRQKKRYSVFLPCQMSEVSFCMFTLCDVSEDGCKLQYSHTNTQLIFHTGDNYTFKILPEVLNTNAHQFKPFCINAQLVWEHQLPTCTQLGFKIENFASTDFKTWFTFIASKSKKQLHPKKRLI